jgi:uncharacterized protein YdhG (YjbR/CyaY superfamily)
MIRPDMPAYKLRGTRLLFFAGRKQHYSIYPADERVVSAFKRELTPYKVKRVRSGFRSPSLCPRS